MVDCLLYTFIKGTFAIYDLESIILLSFATGFFFIITILLILTLTGKSISWQWGAFGWLVQGTLKRYHDLLKMNASVPENIFLLYSSGDIWKFLK